MILNDGRLRCLLLAGLAPVEDHLEGYREK